MTQSSTQMAGLRPMSEAEFRYKVSHTSRIIMPTFTVAIAVLTALALTCFVGRLSFRIVTRRRLYWDDGFLCLAAASLCTAMEIIYHNLFLYYLMNALFLAPEVAASMPIIQYIQPLIHSPAVRNTYSAFIWICIFSVKFCFFAFFKALIRHRRGLIIYYWASVVFTILGFTVCFSEAFVFNRFKSIDDIVRTDWYRLSLTFTILVTFVDLVSDILIVSIPIILLRKSQLRLSTKISIGLFLCLSIFMAFCSIVRAAGYLQARTHVPEIIWRKFWQQAEGCIAVMMASITAFRTLFIAGDRQHEEGNEPAWPKVSWLRSPKHSGGRKEGSEGQDNADIKLPSVPTATFSGLLSFIRKSPGQGQTQISSSAVTIVESEFDPLEADYHAAIRW